MKHVKIIPVLVSALLISALTGCGKNDESSRQIVYYDDSNAYTQKTEGLENSDGEPFNEEDAVKHISTIPGNLNEKIEISGIDITLKNVYAAGEVEYGTETGQKRQVIALNCDVTNNTESKTTVNSFNFVVKYIDGEYMQAETGMRELMTAGRKITNINSLNQSIEPGKTASGYAALSVPLEWQTLTVYFTPSGGISEDSITFEVTRDMLEEP